MDSKKESDVAVSRPLIWYKPVETGDGNVLRFEALTCQNTSLSSGKEWDHLSVQQWTDLLLSEESLMSEFYDLLRIEWPSYYFETKGVSSENASQIQFEFVIVNAPDLNRFVTSSGPNMQAFSSYWDNLSPGETCTSFPNLGGNALLVVPKAMPNTEPSTYTDLASFMRNAPEQEVTNFWIKSLQEYQGLLSPPSNGQIVWFSTSGRGVSFLHVRFDQRPKYYSYVPFKEPAGSSSEFP